MLPFNSRQHTNITRHPAWRQQATSSYQAMFCSSYLDLDPTTLINEYNRKIVKQYLYTNNELSTVGQGFQLEQRQTDRCNGITTPYSRMV